MARWQNRDEERLYDLQHYRLVISSPGRRVEWVFMAPNDNAAKATGPARCYKDVWPYGAQWGVDRYNPLIVHGDGQTDSPACLTRHVGDGTYTEEDKPNGS